MAGRVDCQCVCCCCCCRSWVWDLLQHVASPLTLVALSAPKPFSILSIEAPHMAYFSGCAACPLDWTAMRDYHSCVPDHPKHPRVATEHPKLSIFEIPRIANCEKVSSCTPEPAAACKTVRYMFRPTYILHDSGLMPNASDTQCAATTCSVFRWQ